MLYNFSYRRLGNNLNYYTKHNTHETLNNMVHYSMDLQITWSVGEPENALFQFRNRGYSIFWSEHDFHFIEWSEKNKNVYFMSG